MHSRRKLFGISWMIGTPNTDVLSGRGLPTTFVQHAAGSNNERWKNPRKYYYGGKRHVCSLQVRDIPITLSGRVQAKHEY